jgi:hypothetical protein
MHAKHGHQTSMETALAVARRMPEKRHYLPGTHKFDIMRSEATDWLVAQPEIRQHIWNLMKGALVLDLESGKWRGADSFTG